MRKLAITLLSISITASAYAGAVIDVEPCEGDATSVLQAAIDSAAAFKGESVTIRLAPGDYHISRENSSTHIYHVSNTASATENPDPTKHIGLWFRDLRNVTFDGNGAWLVTHGEMTSMVIDNCENITLTNFTLSSSDPSVPEMKVAAIGSNSMTVEITPPSRYDITDGNFSWTGCGWRFADGARETMYPEFAQVFYPDRNVTLRVESPLKGRKSARELSENVVEFFYDKAPDVHVGEIYQMRHGIRNEVCGFFANSKNITLRNIEFNFLGNFGLVGQYSENLTYDNIRCRPAMGSGRTAAGFADFVQMSGCRGKVIITNSYFEGAHDDPINIHGTHLKAVAMDRPDKMTVRFMHDQTFGFAPFFKGDSVEIVDRHTLRCIGTAEVMEVKPVDDYNFELTLDRGIPALPRGYGIEDVAVENITWTPEVEIRNNYFARIPTRGILITTRRKSVIEDNVFFRMPMPAILVSDDARGWYESGPVRDLTIRRNTFIDCKSPVIAVWPEIERYDGPVHSDIAIEYNRFIMDGTPAISLRAADDVRITGNVFDVPKSSDSLIGNLIECENTSNIFIDNNQLIK